MHKLNAYATLTYANEHLPPGGTLDHRHMQLFLKRLRKRTGLELSYYMCGEYGRTNPVTHQKDGGLYRPHYHILLFGWYADDAKYHTTRGEHKVYTSELLDRTWALGNCEFGSVTFDSAAYVTGYITQKLTGPLAARYGDRKPEYNRMSLNPAIGLRWFRKYKADLYPNDFVVVNGQKAKPPRYYDKLYERGHPDIWRNIALNRELDAAERANDNTPARLEAKEAVALARYNLKKRD